MADYPVEIPELPAEENIDLLIALLEPLGRVDD